MYPDKINAIEHLGFEYSDGQKIFGFERIDHRFEDTKYQQKIQAQSIMDSLCPDCKDDSFDGIDEIFSYDIPDDSKLESETISQMKIQDKKAREFLGTFQSGYRGGVKVCQAADEVFAAASAMLGQVLVTKQTGPDGRLVKKLLVAGAPEIRRELYLAVLLDRAAARPVVMASQDGGMDIEEVAAKTPERIVKEWVDPAVGLMPYQARKVARALGLAGDLLGAGAKLITGVYRTWWECDASLVEINPLCVVAGAEGNETLLAVDAKV